MRVVRSRDEAEAAHERCRRRRRAAFGDGRCVRRAARARTCATSRCKSSATAPVRSSTSGSATAASSAATRSSSRSRPRPSSSCTRSARRSLATRCGSRSEVGFENAGTRWSFSSDATAPPKARPIGSSKPTPGSRSSTRSPKRCMGVDLVQAQLRLAAGDDADGPWPRRCAVAARLRGAGAREPRDGAASTARCDRPVAFSGSSNRRPGPGMRTDTFASTGYRTNPSFDSLLAKIDRPCTVVESRRRDRAYGAALRELRIEGVDTNASFLLAILDHPEVRAGRTTTDFVDRNVAELANSALPVAPSELAPGRAPCRRHGRHQRSARRAAPRQSVGGSAKRRPECRASDSAVVAPIQGTVVSIEVAPGEAVHRGQPLLVMEAMKMEHVIESTMSGIVRALNVVDRRHRVRGSSPRRG